MANSASCTAEWLLCVVNPQSTLPVTHPVDVPQNALLAVIRRAHAVARGCRRRSGPSKVLQGTLANGCEQRYQSYASQTGVPGRAQRSSGLTQPRATAVR